MIKNRNGDTITLKTMIKDNWEKNKGTLLTIWISAAIGTLTQLLACLNTILEFGNGHTWILFLKNVIGVILGAAITTLAVIGGINEGAYYAHLDKHNKKIIDKD